jgi:hypothetical protein
LINSYQILRVLNIQEWIQVGSIILGKDVCSFDYVFP